MQTLLDLGPNYISDFLSIDDNIARQKYSLKLILDDSIGAARLSEAAPLDMMYGKYWYRSGINTSMMLELKNIVEEIQSRIQFNNNDIWLDIACNDGTLLNFIAPEFIRLGIDPADQSYYDLSSKIAHKVVQDFFSLDAYQRTGYGDKKCKVITVIAMFYDLDDPIPFIKDLYSILDDDGILVLQMSYTPLMIQQLAFDNICHEHIYYYSLQSIKKLFNNYGFNIVDCDLNSVNGGSFRVYLQKDTAKPSSFATGPMRDVCNFRVKSILEYENKYFNLNDLSLWKTFENNILSLKDQTVDFIKNAKAQGKVICGYGASTKGNTLLQYFGLDHTLIDAIAERSPYKYGLKTIGTNIPILSEADVRKMNPDYMLVLPWHFISEFRNRERDYLSNGGKFIVPCPKFEIID
jgi:hypothetical protein